MVEAVFNLNEYFHLKFKIENNALVSTTMRCTYLCMEDMLMKWESYLNQSRGERRKPLDMFCMGIRPSSFYKLKGSGQL